MSIVTVKNVETGQTVTLDTALMVADLPEGHWVFVHGVSSRADAVDNNADFVYQQIQHEQKECFCFNH